MSYRSARRTALPPYVGFRPAIITRTAAELKAIVAANPFASRPGIEPAKLVVAFLDKDPGHLAREKAAAIKVGPEEIAAAGRELYIYYPGGQGKSKLTPALLERTLQAASTARNWNTVAALLEVATSP